jgi:hypothetical protein
MGLLVKAAVRNDPVSEVPPITETGQEIPCPQSNDSVLEGEPHLASAAPGVSEISAIIDGYQKQKMPFHCIILHANAACETSLAEAITGMIAHHGSVCGQLPGGNCLVLIPDSLDMELFSHRLSKSAGATVIFQFSAASSAVALEAIKPYL